MFLQKGKIINSRIKSGTEGNNARRIGSGTPEDEFTVALLHGFCILGVNNVLTERIVPLGMTFFPTWAGRQTSGFNFLFVEDTLAQCFESGCDKMPAESQAESLGSSHDKAILHGFKNISELYFGKQP